MLNYLLFYHSNNTKAWKTSYKAEKVRIGPNEGVNEHRHSSYNFILRFFVIPAEGVF